MAHNTYYHLSAPKNARPSLLNVNLSSSSAHRAKTQPLARTQHNLSNGTSCMAATRSSQQATVAEDVQYWDVVEYLAAQGEKPIIRLGLVQEVTADTLQVAPLVEEDQDVWVIEDNTQETPVPAASVIKVVEHLYSQTQDTEHNPHGEHAHDVWQVLTPLSPEVFRGYHVRKLKS